VTLQSRFLYCRIRYIPELLLDGFRCLRVAVRSRAAVNAEILFLRKQLAFYREHQIKPTQLTQAARLSLVFGHSGSIGRRPWSSSSRTLIRWHRKGFHLFWRRKSQMGRPRLPENMRQLIVGMAKQNPTWGQERVASELSLKLGIQVSPRTVRAYWPRECDPRRGNRTGSQHWRTFVRNHAQSIVACDFLVSVTASFRVLYVLVVMEVVSRRILHCNVTSHPTAEWTLQQFREAIPGEHNYKFLIHDRDSIFSADVRRRTEVIRLKSAANTSASADS
jgi:putative transposase